MDSKHLALVAERASRTTAAEVLDLRTHADPPTPDGTVEPDSADPWPFKPGDVVDDAEGAVTEWLDAAPYGTVVVDAVGVEWTNECTLGADEAPAWVLESSRTSPELPDREPSADLANLRPLTVVRIGDR